jgi:hypothetical protein
MSELKCPFCGQELECCGTYIFGTKKLGCANCGLTGDSKLFSELIRTRKALDVAVDALKLISLRYLCEYADKALDQIKQITALEQKDK